MHEIFISYSSKHRALTRDLAAQLEAQYGAGSVWWDQALEARGPYQPQIAAALDAARVVLVVWTAGAQASEYVYAEAVRAHAAHKLVNLRPADTRFDQIPEPFNIHHVEAFDATDRILAAVARVMAGQPMPTTVPLDELYWRQHGQRIVDPKQSRLPADLAEVSPSALLQARHEQAAYLDATGLRAQMLDWALQHPRRHAGRVLHGPGGIGKTRLMIDLAAALRQGHGWHAGFIEWPAAQATDATVQQWRQALEQRIVLGDDPGLLLVIDYAERRLDDLDELADWIGRRPADDARPVRVVLLMRQAGDWWDQRRDESPRLATLFAHRPGWPAELALTGFSDAADRARLFEASWQAMLPVVRAQGFEPVAWNGAAPVSLADASGRPLAIQMAALVALCSGAQAADSWQTPKLLDQVLGLERAHWQRLFGVLDDDARTALERGLAQLTLVQGCPSPRAMRELLMADAHYGPRRAAPADVMPVLTRLQRLYGQDEGLRPLEPDLLGEHLVARVADEHTLEACIGWLSPPHGDAGKSAALVTVLQRATRPEHGHQAGAQAQALARHLIRHHTARFAQPIVQTIIDTPGALAGCLDDLLGQLSEEAHAALEDALPAQTLALGVIAARLAELRLMSALANRADVADDDTDRQNELARRHGQLGVRLAAIGRREDALAAAQEAVDLRRQLAAQRPDAFLPDLAASLNNLGNMFSDLGRREDALAAAQEAVDLYRQLAAQRPDAFLHGLAMSLGARSMTLAAADRHREAAAHSGEGLALLLPMVEQHPQAFGPLGMQLARAHLQQCEAAGMAPDQDPLARLIDALGLEPPDE